MVATGIVTGGIAGANILPVLGFGAAGVKAGTRAVRSPGGPVLNNSLLGTIAAGIQSIIYGATVPAGSWFAAATSWGATGAMATPIGLAGAVVGGAVYFVCSRG